MTAQVQFQSKSKNPSFDTVTDIETNEVFALRDQIEIIDVRRSDEWVGEFGHIAEAKLITLDTLPSRVSELSKTKTIVFVCRSGQRSAQASAFVKGHGLTEVYNMRGGMIEWTKQNLPATERNKNG